MRTIAKMNKNKYFNLKQTKMTKREFLNGKEFMYDSQLKTCYYFENGAIIEASYYKGEILTRQHHANVKNVGTKYFQYYNYILNKKVSGKITFLNL